MVQVDNFSVRSGLFQIQDISFKIKKGSCLALLGKSGSGKTTIIEAICGLGEVTSGNIFIDGKDVTHLPPHQRNVGYVPQENVLFCTMTIREQLAYSLTLKNIPPKIISNRVLEVASSLDICDLLDRYPNGLSGGEAKRVAIGRAITNKPSLLCLDESFTNLDDEALKNVMSIVKSTVKDENITTLFITHKKEEIAEFSDDQYHL